MYNTKETVKEITANKNPQYVYDQNHWMNIETGQDVDVI